MAATPMFPLEVAMLPGEELPLRIFEPRYTALVSDCLAGDPVFGVVLIAAGREVGGGEARHDVGALARIVEHADLGRADDIGCAASSVSGSRVTEWLDDAPYPRAMTVPWPDEAGPSVTGADIAAVEDTVMELFERIAGPRNATLPPREELLGGPEPGQEAGDRLYALAARIPDRPGRPLCGAGRPERVRPAGGAARGRRRRSRRWWSSSSA